MHNEKWPGWDTSISDRTPAKTCPTEWLYDRSSNGHHMLRSSSSSSLSYTLRVLDTAPMTQLSCPFEDSTAVAVSRRPTTSTRHPQYVNLDLRTSHAPRTPLWRWGSLFDCLKRFSLSSSSASCSRFSCSCADHLTRCSSSLAVESSRHPCALFPIPPRYSADPCISSSSPYLGCETSLLHLLGCSALADGGLSPLSLCLLACGHMISVSCVWPVHQTSASSTPCCALPLTSVILLATSVKFLMARLSQDVAPVDGEPRRAQVLCL